MKKVICVVLVFLIALSMSSCGDNGVVGRWRSEVTLSVLEKYGIPDELYIVTLLTGDKLFDIYVQFNSDETFTYDIDTSELEETLSENVGSLIGLISDYDVSSIVKELIAYGFGYASENLKLSYSGTYHIDDNGVIIATDEIPFYFSYSSGCLYETDEYGNEHFTFNRCS